MRPGEECFIIAVSLLQDALRHLTGHRAIILSCPQWWGWGSLSTLRGESGSCHSTLQCGKAQNARRCGLTVAFIQNHAHTYMFSLHSTLPHLFSSSPHTWRQICLCLICLRETRTWISSPKNTGKPFLPWFWWHLACNLMFPTDWQFVSSQLLYTYHLNTLIKHSVDMTHQRSHKKAVTQL